MIRIKEYPSTELKQLFGETRRLIRITERNPNERTIYEEYQTFITRQYEDYGVLGKYTYIKSLDAYNRSKIDHSWKSGWKRYITDKNGQLIEG